MLQESIIDIYGNCPEYDTFQPEEKKALLGPIHWKNPARFKFLPGEKASLISIKILCSSLVGKLPLVYISPIIEQATPTFNVKAGRQASIHTERLGSNATGRGMWNTVESSSTSAVSTATTNNLITSSPNGSLTLHTFRPEQFRPDVHAGPYRLLAANFIGRILSTPVRVHAGLVSEN
ncbi:hypothetical protein OUZ56_005865 [Daphnia magna]|uniref:Uncharacterized protein n=1 Tax=Daphnia magna TaxID=35525 RepID=A0ABQ9YU82_9CRUS|nr:hypothetical protein OUZ56_005865 [Daphnia magna]